MSADSISLAGLRGHVQQHSSLHGLIREGHNQVVNLAPEIIMAALMGSTSIYRVAFGLTGGRVVTPATRSVPGIVAQISDPTRIIGRDKLGRRTLGTWRVTWTPDEAQSYDMLGLLAASGQLFAATAFTRVDLQANESVAVSWTIYLRD